MPSLLAARKTAERAGAPNPPEVLLCSMRIEHLGRNQPKGGGQHGTETRHVQIQQAGDCGRRRRQQRPLGDEKRAAQPEADRHQRGQRPAPEAGGAQRNQADRRGRRRNHDLRQGRDVEVGEINRIARRSGRNELRRQQRGAEHGGAYGRTGLHESIALVS
jgi:hypothetical protein